MFNRLFESGQIGSMTLRNRIIMPPMYTGLAIDGYASDQLIEYLAARAAGGAGLIIVEMSVVEPAGRLFVNQPALWDDKFISGLSRLADMIHKHGAKIGIQVGHGGARALSAVTGTQPVSCSPIAGVWGEVPRELSVDEIKRLIDAFASASQRAKKAGIDGVEIHCAHGYLLRQFLSAYSNKRTDEYGGDLKGRAKLPIAIMKSVRQELGRDYPLWFRINGSDFVKDGGFTIYECKRVSKWLVEAGANAVSVSAGTYESHTQMVIQPMFVRRGVLVPLASDVKKVVDVPVIAAGRINTPDFAERILQQGKADFIAMGRELIADPDLPIKAAEGRINEIRRCLACNECIDRLRPADPAYRISCTVNAAVGKEKEYEIKPAGRKKKVMVIGGGPAGMEAARIAAMRGHRVTLYEKNSRLGGQIMYAARGPHKYGLSNLTRFLSGQLKKAGVIIRRTHEVTAAMVYKENPSEVILATGASPLIPPIAGISQKNAVTAIDVLTGKAVTGNTVIVIGGGRVGLEVAEVLIKKGKAITVVEMLPQMGSDMGLSFRVPALRTLRRLNAQMLTSARAEEIRHDILTVDKDGEKIKLKADTIVIAAGARSDDQLYCLLQDKVSLHVIGDCARPRSILDGIAEGSRVAREI